MLGILDVFRTPTIRGRKIGLLATRSPGVTHARLKRAPKFVKGAADGPHQASPSPQLYGLHALPIPKSACT